MSEKHNHIIHPSFMLVFVVILFLVAVLILNDSIGQILDAVTAAGGVFLSFFNGNN